MGFIHDESTGKSSFRMWNATTMNNDPVAIVEIPHRVPYGSHGFFMEEAMIKA